MKKLYTSAVFFIIALITFNVINNDIESTVEKKNNDDFFSQKKSYVKGKLKNDSPNLFAEYYKLIKSEIGKSNSKYSTNYIFDELKKADKGRVFGKKLDDTWVSRGPGNVGGRARGIIIDPDDPTASTWFIAAVGGGVWKTADSGTTWVELTKDKGSLSASYMAMAPSNHNVIYLGTGEGFGNLDALGGQGIWKSTDRGVSWSQLVSTTSSSFGIINRIIVDPTNENILLAATNSGIWKSLDGGQNWGSNKYPTSGRVHQIINVPGDFTKMIASVSGIGIIKSTDSGESWSLKSSGLTKGRIELAIAESNTNVLYASAYMGYNTPSEIYISRDQGVNWIQCTGDSGFLGGQGWYDNAIVVDPYDETTFFVAGVHMYKIQCNADNTLNVKMLTNNYGSDPSLHKGTHVDNHYFEVMKLNESSQTFRLVGTNDGGMCFTDDEGETFTQPNAGFITAQFYGVDKANGKELYIGGMQDNSCYLSPLGSTATSKWKYAFGGDGFDVIWNYSDENKVMLTSQYNYIGVTHSGINSIVDDVRDEYWIAEVDKGSDDAPFLTKLTQSKQYPELVLTYGKNGVWRTEDFGKTWNNINMPDDYAYIIDGDDGYFIPTIINISLVDPSVVWTGSSVHSNYSMYVSKDFGKTFNPVNSSNLVSSYISGFATHPTDVNTAYALFSAAGKAKVLKTTDLGQNWVDISGFSGGVSNNGFPDVAVFDLLVVPNSSGKIWVGTEIGIFETTDNAVSWHLLENGLPPVSVYDLIVVNDQVVVGTHGRGVWSVTLPGLEGYEPPSVFIPASIESAYLFENSKQYAEVDYMFRSDYDNVKIFLNEELIKESNNVTGGDSESLNIEIPSGENQIKIVVALGDKSAESISTIMGLPLKLSTGSFVNNFNSISSISDEFYGDGFLISQPSGFNSEALNTSHPYVKDETLLLYLNTPIVVNEENPDFSFKDVAIIEPGENGTVYPDSEFWDYVTIEGSVDGQNWIPMITPYDSRFDNVWKNKYLTSADPDNSDYRSHIFKTTDFFNAGDVILIRFKLFSDEAAVGWGWIIDDLEIQKGALSLDKNKLVTEFKIYPNPVVDEYLFLEANTERKIDNIELYNVSGQLVLSKTILSKSKAELNVSGLTNGQYVLRVKTDNGVFSKKIIVE